jgi:hypothetical protein
LYRSLAISSRNPSLRRLLQDPMMDFLPSWYHLYSGPNYAKKQCYESIVLSQGLLRSQESLTKHAERIPEQGAWREFV